MATGPELIRDALAETGIGLAASLPDDWLSDVIRLLEEDERFTHVAVAREEEVVGICSGRSSPGSRPSGSWAAPASSPPSTSSPLST
jgi:sulfopyruvate decarboxylase TPP-binding subunit